MTLMIVDDSNLIRTAVRNAVKNLPLEVVGTAADGETALALFDATSPQMVTLDITMPKMDGLECLAEIMRRNPNTAVVVITALKDEATGLRAIKLGARGIVPKPFTADRLASELSEIDAEMTGGS
jgi:two-component system, chemotaxis family, chemotaxis protein CheY